MKEKAPNNAASATPEAVAAVNRLAGVVEPHGSRRGRLAKCQATRKDGQPCGAGTTARSGYTKCFFHSEEHLVPMAEKRAAWTKGGLVATRQFALPNAPGQDLRTPEQITAAATETANRVMRGELAPGIAMALSALYGVALRAFDADVARRLYELEAALAERAKPVAGKRLESVT
jgi:hypothetical protein